MLYTGTAYMPATRQELIPLPRTGGILAMRWLQYNDPSIPATRRPPGSRRSHSDFVWLDEQLRIGWREILPGLTYLPSGDVTDIGEDRECIRVGGIGGCHGPSNYERRSRDLQRLAKRHFTLDECERLSG